MHDSRHRRTRIRQLERTTSLDMHGSMDPCIHAEPNLQNLLDACFASREVQDEIRTRINQLDSDSISSNRIIFSIIRFILENYKKGSYSIDLAFNLAKSDWRDLLMSTSHGDDLEAHGTWAKSILHCHPKVILEEPPQKPISINRDGWTQCPACNFKFKISDPNAWDGKRHLRCSQPLKIDNRDS